MTDQHVRVDACPKCGSTTNGLRDAIDRLTRQVETLREGPDQRRVAALEGEVRQLRETVARLRGSLGAPH